MKTFKFRISMFAVMIAAMFLLSCSQTDVIIDDETTTFISKEFVVKSEPVLLRSDISNEEQIALKVKQKGTYRISENEAMETLERFAKDYGNNAIRTKNVSLKKSSKTGNDLYYEVVFEGAKGTGFALLSADERTDNLLCYTEVGSISDTSYIKNMKFCIDLIDLYVEEKTNMELNIEDLTLSAKEKLASSGRISTELTDEVTLRNIPPFDPNTWTFVQSVYNSTLCERIKGVPGGWHQGSPYNSLLDYVSGIASGNGRAWVGCDMIATSQVMAYHRKAVKSYIIQSDWTSMIANHFTSSLLQTLMQDLHFTMRTSTPTVSGTTSTINEAKSFLGSNGYTVGSVDTYSFNTAWNALSNGPTIMRGTDSYSGSGHAWVVDGVHYYDIVSYDLWIYNYNGKILEYYDNYLSLTIGKQIRIDWGWGHQSSPVTGYNINTWYSDNVFQVSVYNSSGGTNNHNYNSSLKIINSIQ